MIGAEAVIEPANVSVQRRAERGGGKHDGRSSASFATDG
jgi:hypothetical protein